MTKLKHKHDSAETVINEVLCLLSEDGNASQASSEKVKKIEVKVEEPVVDNDLHEKLLEAGNLVESKSEGKQQDSRKSNVDRNTFLDVSYEAEEKKKQKHKSMRIKASVMMLQTCSQGYQLLNLTGTNDMTLTSGSALPISTVTED